MLSGPWDKCKFTHIKPAAKVLDSKGAPPPYAELVSPNQTFLWGLVSSTAYVWNRKVSTVIANKLTKYGAEDYSIFKTLHSQIHPFSIVKKYFRGHLGLGQLPFIGILGVEGM